MIPFALFLACIEPSGMRVTAADIAAMVPDYRALPSDTVLGYAPQPGFTRTFTPAELNRPLPAAHDATPRVLEPVCVQWKLSRPDPDAFRTAMVAELPGSAQLAVLEISDFPVPKGTVRFPLSGLGATSTTQTSSLWRGFVEYAPGARFDVWARVDVHVPAVRMVAAQEIPAGTTITEHMLRSETISVSPGKSTGAGASAAEIVGRSTRQLIREGAPVLVALLDKRTDVRKGDAVRVHVRAGAASVGFEGTALAAAVSGDTIPVRVNETGRTVRARIDGPGEAVVQLMGGN